MAVNAEIQTLSMCLKINDLGQDVFMNENNFFVYVVTVSNNQVFEYGWN